MPTDFLTSLSSRVLQPPEADVTGSGLKPRLTSRFENPEAPSTPFASREPASETWVDAESLEHKRSLDISSASEHDRIQGAQKRPVQEISGLGMGMATQHRLEESKRFFENDMKPVVANLLKTMPSLQHSESFPTKSAPVSMERAESLAASQKSENNPQLRFSPVSATLSAPPPPSRPVETHNHIMQPPPASLDLKNIMQASAPSAAPPLSQTKVVPERIEITRIERQSQPAVNAPQIVPSLELPAFQPQNRMPETQEQSPTIHVTIGRIEVKAATPAAAPKRGAPAPPAMSLDEYLRRRAGGDR